MLCRRNIVPLSLYTKRVIKSAPIALNCAVGINQTDLANQNARVAIYQNCFDLNRRRQRPNRRQYPVGPKINYCHEMVSSFRLRPGESDTAAETNMQPILSAENFNCYLSSTTFW